MKNYYESIGEDPFKYIPLTFHIINNLEDKEFERFVEEFKKYEQQDKDRLDLSIKEKKKKPRPTNIWIIKPGENTNRGSGIKVCNTLEQIKAIVGKKVRLKCGRTKSYIIQKYMDNPLLINKRKFDIRCYVLVTAINGNLCGYWYKDGYIRTSCKEFSLKNVTNKFIHLTNDAIQKKADNYGKFEPGNKMSYNEFQKHFDQNFPDLDISMESQIVPQMKKIATDSIKATFRQLDKNGRHHTFEVFGYDFMVEETQTVKLIEVNTNPCLELSSNYLSRIIPAMIDNLIKIAVDPIFPAPECKSNKKSQYPDYSDNKFELIFNKLKDSVGIINLKQTEVIIEEDEDDDREDDEDDENEADNGESDID